MLTIEHVLNPKFQQVLLLDREQARPVNVVLNEIVLVLLIDAAQLEHFCCNLLRSQLTQILNPASLLLQGGSCAHGLLLVVC
jgi:hypothetical protein